MSKEEQAKFSVTGLLIKIGIVLFAVIGIAGFYLSRYDSVKDTVVGKVTSVKSEFIRQRVEIEVLSNQAVTDIEARKADSIAELENKAKELSAEDRFTNPDKGVPKDILKELNAARKETHK